MSQQSPPETPRGSRRDRIFLIVSVSIGAVLVLAFVVALVIHFVLLNTDRFNWLEAPKRSSLPAAERVAASAYAAPSR